MSAEQVLLTSLEAVVKPILKGSRSLKEAENNISKYLSFSGKIKKKAESSSIWPVILEYFGFIPSPIFEDTNLTHMKGFFRFRAFKDLKFQRRLEESDWIGKGYVVCWREYIIFVEHAKSELEFHSAKNGIHKLEFVVSYKGYAYSSNYFVVTNQTDTIIFYQKINNRRAIETKQIADVQIEKIKAIETVIGLVIFSYTNDDLFSDFYLYEVDRFTSVKTPEYGYKIVGIGYHGFYAWQREFYDPAVIINFNSKKSFNLDPLNRLIEDKYTDTSKAVGGGYLSLDIFTIKHTTPHLNMVYDSRENMISWIIPPTDIFRLMDWMVILIDRVVDIATGKNLTGYRSDIVGITRREDNTGYDIWVHTGGLDEDHMEELQL